MSEKFPDPTYARTVLAPLFDDVKTHYAEDMDRINRAHLVMLAETRIVSSDVAGKLARALQEIAAGTDLSSLEYTGEHEDYFFWVEAQLIERLGADIAGRLHTARSRNDMDHTLFRMSLRKYTLSLLGSAVDLAEAVLTTAQRHETTPIVAYTHGQPAQATSYGHYLAAVLEELLSDIERMSQALDVVDHSPMGAAAITGTGFGVDRDRVAALLGFSHPTQNTYRSIAGVGYITGTYSAMRLMFLHLGRVLQDMQVWSSFEVGQLYVPGAFVQISSIMPQKRNPVPIEHMRHLASQTYGAAGGVIDVVHNTPFTDMNDSEGSVQVAGYRAFATGERVLSLLAAMLPTCEIDGARVAQNAGRAGVTVTELADTLVRREGISFRAAHHIAADTIKAAIAKNADLGDVYTDFTRIYREHAGADTTLGEADFKACVSLENFIAVRETYGAPGADAFAHACARYTDELAQYRATIAAYQDHIQQADSALTDAVKRLAEET